MEEGKWGKLSAVLDGKIQTPPPVWLMRQAGRYLPEYREARAKAGSFWNLCMEPDWAAEVTLQPVRRFGLDAAILFSDILLVPYALGQEVTFEEGLGPRVQPVLSVDGLVRAPDQWRERLMPVYDALGRVAAQIDCGTDLIGFAGGPWTLATYMAEGRGSAEQRAARLWGYRDPCGFKELLGVIADCVARHLCGQIAAGATLVQIFDSWAGGLSEQAFQEWVVVPTRQVVDQVRKSSAGAKIIGFPRGATLEGYRIYAKETGVDGISLDTAVPMRWAARELGASVSLQGNLDPTLLVAGGTALTAELDRLLAATRDVPFIANLGHGILPETPVTHVAEFVGHIRSVR